MTNTNPFTATPTSTEQEVGIDPTMMATEQPELPDAKKEVKRLPQWAANTAKEIFRALDPILRARAAILSCTNNATIEILMEGDDAESYAHKVVSAVFFGAEVDTKTKKGLPVQFKLSAKPEIVEAIYDALPEEIKKAANNRTADGEKIAKTSVMQGAVDIFNKGVSREIIFSSFSFSPKQIAVFEKRLLGLDTTKDEENLTA